MSACCLQVSEVEVKEDKGQVEVTVQRTGGTTGLISCTFQTADGTALAGADYIKEKV